jgi:hypothetical protein
MTDQIQWKATGYAARPKWVDKIDGGCEIRNALIPNQVLALVFGGTEESCEKRARLIAAAPDLLEALLEVQEYVHNFGESHLTDKVNAAIAKARGE